MMLAVAPDLVSFWLMPWSEPFRAACLWFTLDTQPLRGKQARQRRARSGCARSSFSAGSARPSPPGWPGSRRIQRRGAIALKTNPPPAGTRWPGPAIPGAACANCAKKRCCASLAWKSSGCCALPRSRPCWWATATGPAPRWAASEHIAQLYAELKRRHKAQRARAILSLELRQYVEWQPARPDAEEESVW